MPHQIITFGHNGTYTIKSDWISNIDIVNQKDPTFVASNTIPFSDSTASEHGSMFLKGVSPLNDIMGDSSIVPVRIWRQLEIDCTGYYPRLGILNEGPPVSSYP